MSRTARAAGWIAEAFSTGNPLAELPDEIAPRRRSEGERVALRAIESLGLPPCGLRMSGGIAGPLIEGRILPDGTAVAGLRHPVVTAALLAVLAEPLDPGSDALPAFAALHPALDVADHRFTQPPRSAAQRAADLAGLGFVVVGAPLAPEEELRLGAAPANPAEVLAPVAAAARRLGGLPAGALLVAAGLSAPIAADSHGLLRLDFGVGSVTARFP
ncbi:hypothetical protein [Muricoccus pecuniae]|uniref:2-keto-4-pentenoate hydratase n=1 Tax=Muricoccus pecuniae TaxID=693023 RepID=A0A840Y1D0_9PROT|nr:hypothetical protein [Roseomonas pecuniae]MBB5692619.1 hypothetical protein [Roseomonas pecuniae]